MITIIIIKITYINNGDNNDDNNSDKTSNKSPLHQVVSNLHFSITHPPSFAATGASEACFFEELRHTIIFGLAHGEHTWAPKMAVWLQVERD